MLPLEKTGIRMQTLRSIFGLGLLAYAVIYRCRCSLDLGGSEKNSL